MTGFALRSELIDLFDGIHRSRVYELVARDNFPKPIAETIRGTPLWDPDTVRAWQEERMARWEEEQARWPEREDRERER